jgi:kynurenine formamidase
VGAAQWLIDRGVAVAGGETIAFEQIKPGAGHGLLPVHRMFLVEQGINIIETMRLTELLDSGVTEFLFVLAPIRVVGATGAPVRPLAVVTAV